MEFGANGADRTRDRRFTKPLARHLLYKRSIQPRFHPKQKGQAVTTTQVLIEVAKYRPMGKDALYKHFRKLKIKPVGKVRQCPQQYPDDAPKRVLALLGVKVNGKHKP